MLPEDFHIQEGSRGPLLCNSIKGISFVFFYSKKCETCQHFLPVFKNLPRYVPNVVFAEANVLLKNMAIYRMSQATIKPLTFVPFFVCYVNGVPFMMYEGPRNIENIREFLFDVINKISAKREFTSGKVCKGSENDPIPAYCLNRPSTISDPPVCIIDPSASVSFGTGSYSKYADVFGNI